MGRPPVAQETVLPPDPPSGGVAASSRVVGRPVAAPASSTLQLYAGEWAGFVAWCRHHGLAPLPATSDALAAYLLAAAPQLSRGALGRRRAAIGAMHRQANFPVPRLDAASRKALRTTARPVASSTAKGAPTAASLVRVAARCPRDLAGLRDRALLLLAAATRRSRRQRPEDGALPTDQPDSAGEPDAQVHVPRLFLLSLDAEDVRFTETGAVLRLKSRIDEPEPSRVVTLPRAIVANACPVRALEDWLRSSETMFGPVFRKVDRWGNVEHARLGPDAWRGILARRSGPSGAPTRRETAS